MEFWSDQQRRHQLVARHGLTESSRPVDVLSATRAVGVLHATEPATVYLSLQARCSATVGQIETVLYQDRSVVKQLAMRRTLFGFPRELLPAALGSASSIVAERERRRLIKDVEAAQLSRDGAVWLAAAREAVLGRLAGGVGLQASQLREELVALQGRLSLSPGKAYGGEFPVAPRVLTWLAARGEVMRSTNASHWRTSRPLWMLTQDWLGEEVVPLPEREGFAMLVAAYVEAFGPVRTDDVVWWLGMGVGVAKRALLDCGAVEVALEIGTGWVTADQEPPTPPGSGASLLPVLDATVMGWKHREFYLGGHQPSLFDRNGNAGTTAWWEGRVVGCWVQAADGQVVVDLIEPVTAQAEAALSGAAEWLTGWLDGVVVGTVYPSPAMKATREKMLAR